jgi:WD40 repeat protein
VRRRLRVTNIALGLVVILLVAAGVIYAKYRVAQRDAARTSGQWAMRAAIDHINEDRSGEALAFLAHAMRSDAGNVIARRLALDLLTSRLWYVVREVWAHKDVRLLNFSPDGKRLLIVSENSAITRDLPDGELKQFPRDEIRAANWTADSSGVVTMSRRVATVFDVASERQVAEWEEEADINDFIISPDGSLIAVVTDDQIVVREIGGKFRFPIPLPKSYLLTFRFSQDGAQFVVANNWLQESKLEISVWDTESGSQLGEPIMKEFDPNAFVIDPAMKWVAIARKDSLTLQPLAGAREERTLTTRAATNLDFRRDDGALLAVIDGRVHLMLLDGDGALLEEKSFGNAIASASFTADGLRVVTSGVSGQLRFWTPDGQPLSALVGEGEPMAAVSGDGRQIALGAENSVSLLSTPGLLQFALPASWVDISSDEESVLVQTGSVTESLSASTGLGSPERTFRSASATTPPVLPVALLKPLPDSEMPWQILDPARGTRIPIDGLPRGTQPAYDLEFSGNGKRILYTIPAEPFSASVHDLVTGALIRRLVLPPGQKTSVTKAALNFDGSRAAFIGGNGRVMVFDVATGTPRSFEFFLRTIEFSRDGKQLIGSDGWRMWILDAESFTMSKESAKHTAHATFAEFSDDVAGKYVVTATKHGTARVLMRDSMKPISPPLRHAGALISVDFSADGRRFATSTTSDSQVRVWDTATGLPLTASYPTVYFTTWLGTPGRRMVIMDRGGFARVIELAEGTADDATLLAETAEQVAGLRYQEGTLARIEEPMKMDVPDGDSEVARLVGCLLATDASRRVTPFTETTLATLINQRLAAAGKDREAVAKKLSLVYPGLVPTEK